MTEKEKLYLIEETLELEKDSLTPDIVLTTLEQYDSLGKITLIAMFDDQFNKTITGEDVRNFMTVGDILALMQ